MSLALIATPALAQTLEQQNAVCTSSTTPDDERIAACTAVIQSGRSTDPADLYYDRGVAYDDKGLYDQAIADDNQAIALKPDYANAWGNRGVDYYNKGLYDQAINDLSRAIALGPTAIDYDARGGAYLKKGLYDQTIADDNQAIALKPDLQTSTPTAGMHTATRVSTTRPSPTTPRRSR